MIVHKPGRAASGRRAFTLVEVLASLALVAIILPVAMKGISTALHVASLAKQRSVAGSLAYMKLAEMVATGDLEEALAQGDFPDDPDYTWTAEIVEWDGITVEKLEVSVLWTSRGQERAVTLDTLVYRAEN
jgi:prepilin-type N-terminal cleavage/methylation domain-containing protein